MNNDSDDNDNIPLAIVLRQTTGGPSSNVEESSQNLQECSYVNYLHEYKWPKSNHGQFKMLFENLVAYLQINPNDSTLNNLKRQDLLDSEKTYLSGDVRFKMNCIDKNTQSVLAEDACDFMVEHFPEKFKEYLHTSHHHEIKKIVLHQEKQRAQGIQGKMPSNLKRALKQTAEYNSQLNALRKDERCAYFDLQTQIIHHPQKKQKFDPHHQYPQYPIAVLPGQFQEYFKRYSPEELQCFPLNTVLKTTEFKSLFLPNENENNGKLPVDKKSSKDNLNISMQKNDNEKDNFCGICMKGEETNKNGVREKLINCSQCSNGGHPSCLDMNKNILNVIKGYAWQCMECKVCTECLAPHDEDEMMFCDNCDRGYHSYCVGVKEIPKGRWVCNRCGKCCSCLTREPVPDGGKGHWKMEFTKPTDGSQPEFLQSHCRKCSILFRKGSFCPVCLKVYCDDDDVINPMVCCDTCDRWIHTDCDGIDEQRYTELSKDHRSAYTCVLCRGEKEERMDLFHRNNRR